MIVVIADDVSGAAELAGVAHAWGLRVELQTEFDPRCAAEVVALDTDTRSASPAEASRRIQEVARQVSAAQPAWIYKKTDSVLRGHVRRELSALLEMTKNHRVLLIPANPSRGRIIRKGRYYVNGTPLDETIFANDPEYPAKSASVQTLLGRSSGVEVFPTERKAQLPNTGIVIPDVTRVEDLIGFASLNPERTLFAGASEFFGSLLAARVKKRRTMAAKTLPVGKNGRSLFICGSAAAWSVRRHEFEARGLPAFSLEAFELKPWIVSPDEAPFERLADAVGDRFESHRAVLIGIGDMVLPGGYTPSSLMRAFAKVVCSLVLRNPADRLLLEGGATAAAVLRQMNWCCFPVQGMLSPAIAAFCVAGTPAQLLAIKPGTYDWPESVWPSPVHP